MQGRGHKQMTFRVVLRQLCCGSAGRDQLRRPQPSGENHLAKCGTERQQLEPKVWQTPLTTCQLPLDQHCLGEQVWAGLAQGCPGPSLKRCWLPVPTGETEWERSSATQHADSQPRSPRPPRREEALGHGACRADLPHTWGRCGSGGASPGQARGAGLSQRGREVPARLLPGTPDPILREDPSGTTEGTHCHLFFLTGELHMSKEPGLMGEVGSTRELGPSPPISGQL